MLRVYRSTAGRGRLRVSALAVPTVEGVLVAVFGGERPHIGAVALAVPHPRSRGGKPTTASTLTLPGHRDDEIARPASEEAAGRLGVPVVVAAGVHVDGAERWEIARLVENSLRAVERLVRRLEGGVHARGG